MKVHSSGYETPSTVTCDSCMHSSSAACVFGDARLTSPTSRRFATIAPTSSAGAGATALSAKQPLYLVEDRGGDLALRCLADRLLAAGTDERHLVVGGLEADVAARDVVEDEEVGVLAGALGAGALEPGVALVGREADEQLAGNLPLAECREHVCRRLELDRPGVVRL